MPSKEVCQVSQNWLQIKFVSETIPCFLFNILSPKVFVILPENQHLSSPNLGLRTDGPPDPDEESGTLSNRAAQPAINKGPPQA